jgi:hypothetical protein
MGSRSRGCDIIRRDLDPTSSSATLINAEWRDRSTAVAPIGPSFREMIPRLVNRMDEHML